MGKDENPRVGNQSEEVGEMPNWSYRVRSGSSADALQSAINALARDGWELDKLVVIRETAYAVLRRERQPGDEEDEAAEQQAAKSRNVWAAS